MNLNFSAKAETILVLNSGSSSLKFSLFEKHSGSRPRMRGEIQGLNTSHCVLRYSSEGRDYEKPLAKSLTQAEAVREMLDCLRASSSGPLGSLSELGLLVHRVVQGGQNFRKAVLLSPSVISELEALSPLAPLHNPFALLVIKILAAEFPELRQAAVFDTSFHCSLPEYAALYGLPLELSQQHKLRRYGFHGHSHQYVSLKLAEDSGLGVEQLRIISCHLGSGSSVCAIKAGRSVDVSMGFTPTEGLLMGTRCGDLDPGLLLYLQTRLGLTAERSLELLNKESGLLGLSALSNDMRDILAAKAEGHRGANLAFQVYCYRLKKYLGAYLAVLGGAEAIVFTGGIGSGSAEVRAEALAGLEELGIELDQEKNLRAEPGPVATEISAKNSRVRIYVLRSAEELMMAREASELYRAEQLD